MEVNGMSENNRALTTVDLGDNHRAHRSTNEDHPNLEPFLTIPEFARSGLVPLGETKLYELANTGKIPSYRIDKKIMVLASEVHEAVKKFSKRFNNGKAFNR